MPDLPSNLASAIRSERQEDFAANVEDVLYDITDSFNARCDSQRQNLLVSTLAALIPDLPTYGSGILMCNGTRNGQPAAIFTLCKADKSLAGMVKELMQVSGTGEFQDDTLTVTWPANTSPQISATSSMQINVLWRN